MDIGSILLITALMVAVGLFLARPLLEGSQINSEQPVEISSREHTYSSLLAERDRILNALQELDFDATLGKIPAEDYPAQRTFLLQEGSEILRQLDEFQKDQTDEAVEARLEAVIAARRLDAAQAGKIKPSTAITVDDDVELLLSQRRRERAEKSGGFCPQCGKPIQKSDRFCPKCGSALNH